MTVMHKWPVVSVSSIKGQSVKNRHGELLGRIKELMIDSDSGRIAYAVLDIGTSLDIGSKLIAVPWTVLKVYSNDNCILMLVETKLLEEAEGFAPDDWPDFADLRWGARIHAHYNTTPYWK